jgi:uncharacterized membrane protein
VVTATAGSPADTTSTRTAARIIGIDVARALAMVGMLVAHFVEAEPDGGPASSVKAFTDGRAMPLFVLLGGVGVVLLTRRSPTPDLALLTRAALLFPAGLLLQEHSLAIAVILQYYAVFFVLAIGLRRLPEVTLVPLAGAVALAGAFTAQTIGPDLPTATGWDGVDDLDGLAWALLVNGYYPVLPTLAFFLVGMWVAHRRLDDPVVARRLAGVGVGLALLGYVGARWVVDRYGFGPWEDGEFAASRLLDADGHSDMVAWVVGATGTSLAALGLCLLAARAWGRWLGPAVVVGQMALTFYVAQVLIHDRWLPRSETTIGEEYRYAAAILVGFTALALLWRRLVGRGPLEAVLRIGDLAGRRRSAP